MSRPTLTVHCEWKDETAMEMTQHPQLHYVDSYQQFWPDEQ